MLADAETRYSKKEKTNVLKTGPVIEPKKLPVHGSLVGQSVEPLSNRYWIGNVINIYFIILYNIKN